MSRVTPMALFVAFATIGASAPLAAQGRSTAGSAMLEAAVTAPAAATARTSASRADVTAALASSEAVAAAKRLGLGTDELAARTAALDDHGVQQISALMLAGGSTNVVISTTAIIIILLLLILLTN